MLEEKAFDYNEFFYDGLIIWFSYFCCFLR